MQAVSLLMHYTDMQAKWFTPWRSGWITLVVVISACSARLLAGDTFDHDLARSALQSGQAMPFTEVHGRLKKLCDCQVLEAKLHPEKAHGISLLVYEIKALKPNGQIVKLEMNAASGEILQMKSKGGLD